MDPQTNRFDAGTWRPGTMDAAAVEARTQQFMAVVFSAMAMALLVTAVAAWVTASSESLLGLIFGSRVVWLVLALVQFGGAIALMRFVHALSPAMAVGLFTAYAGLTGMLFSSILLVFTGESIVSVFAASAGMFAGMGIYGATVKRSLAGWGTFLLMGLIGTIIVSLVNIWLRSPMINFLLGMAGVVTFAELTAWDVQRLRQVAAVVPDEGFMGEALRGALSLYLDFINLFLSLLRLLGRRRS